MTDGVFAHLSAAALLLAVGKITVLLALAMGGARLLGKAAAGFRHLWWLVVLSAILVIPVLNAARPLRISVLPASLSSSSARELPAMILPSNATPAAGTATSAETPLPADRERAHDAASPENTIRPDYSLRQQPDGLGAPTHNGLSTRLRSLQPLTYALILWLAGMVISLAWLLRSWLALSRIVRRADLLSAPEWTGPLYEIADRMGLEEAPRLLLSTDVRMPFACGLTSPTIVLPVSSGEWSASRRRAVLLHELAHVRRNDLVGHTLARLVCAVYWFHPMVWVAARALRNESEKACDDLAVSLGTRPSDYAEHLLDIVTSIRADATPLMAMAMARRSEFEGRMLAILDPQRSRRSASRRQLATLFALMGAVTLLLGAAAPASPASLKPDPSATPESLNINRTPTLPSGEATAATMAAAMAATDSVTTQESVADTARSGAVSVAGDTIFLRDTTHTRRPRKAWDNSVDTRDIANTIRNAMSFEWTGLADHTVSQMLFSLDSADIVFRKDRSRNQSMSNLSGRIGQELAEAVMDGLFSASPAQYSWAGADPSDSAATAGRIRLLRKLLSSDSSASTRRAAAWRLGSYLRADNAVGVSLTSSLQHDSDAGTREMSAWALSHDTAASPATTAALVAALRDSNRSVRGTAAWTLGTLRAHDAVSALTSLLGDIDPGVRQRAAWALGRLAPRALAPTLASRLGDENRDVRRALTWALYRINDANTAPDLMKAIRNEKDQRLRREMIRTVLVLSGESSGILSEMIESSDQEMREQAKALLLGRNRPFVWPWPWPDPRVSPGK